jgi:hypothetical protein
LGESQKKLKEFDGSFNRLSGAIPRGSSKFSAGSFYQPDTALCGNLYLSCLPLKISPMEEVHNFLQE